MKKYLYYVIVVLVIICVSGVYANVDKKVPIYDVEVDTSNYGNMGELVEDVVVQQEFVCTKPVLDGISIKCATFGNVLTSTYEYQLIDAETSEVLRDGIIQSEMIQNSRYYTFEFEQLENCQNRRLVLCLESDDATSGNAITVYNVPKGEEDAQLRLNSDSLENNTLAMRTISHMFDVETFICVVFCLLYLYIFVKVLFKFFS